MGLGIFVGELAWRLADGRDSEGVEECRRGLAEVNRVLAEHGLPPHVEPELLPNFRSRSRLDHMPYSWIADLHRAIAYARRAPTEFTPVRQGEDSFNDVRVVYERSVARDSHLVCHSGEGYYVPIDFPRLLDDGRIKGGTVGSSQRALKELIQVAPLLRISIEDNMLPTRRRRRSTKRSTRSTARITNRFTWSGKRG